MNADLNRRGFLQLSTLGAAACAAGWHVAPLAAQGAAAPYLVSPGCRGTKVRVARLYLGVPNAHWPTPSMKLEEEVARYNAEMAQRPRAFADIDFALDEVVTTPEQAAAAAKRLKDVDGVLAIHLSMGVSKMLQAVLAAQKPTMLFAAPYSGHEWTSFGKLQNSPEGALLDCMLTADFEQLATAVRPFRAIHHLREARILNVTMGNLRADYCDAIRDKFGTEIVKVDKPTVMDAYEDVEPAAAEAEAERWITGAQEVREPARDEIVRSARLALAFERIMTREKATCITVECYGSMYRQLPAFPCIGFTRLNDMGLAGICESDLQSAVTFLLLQALTGKPGFISDPTVDEGTQSIILAHCLGSTLMDGPDGEACPYRIRTIMEREEGAVPQVFMPVNRKVTQAELLGAEELIYFTGDVIDAPDSDRGCRTKIAVRVDGDLRTLWQNWSHGLHRVTVYEDATEDLRRFCKFTGIKMRNEALPVSVA